MLRLSSKRWGLSAVPVVVVFAAACGGSSDSAPDAQAALPSETPAAQLAPAAEGPPEETNGRRAESGDSVFYHGTLDGGDIFDSSRDRGAPFSFVVGLGQVIAGFDAAVIGLSVGDVVTVAIPPVDAYGDPDPALIIDVPLDQAPPGVQVGGPVSFGGGAAGTVVEITDDIVRVDANHPLAGETLTFEIELLSIE